MAITNPTHFRVGVEDGRGGFDEQSFDVTFVAPLRGSIAGTVFVDATGDGTQQADETALEGVAIYADLNGNQFPDPNEPQAVSDANGDYLLDQLLPGDYPLRFSSIAGFAALAPVTATVDANHETRIDAAMTELGLGQIRGRVLTEQGAAAARVQVFADLDRNGTLDPAEPTVLTDRRGDFALTDLTAGDYEIRALPLAGWQVTDPADGFRQVTLEQDRTAAGNDFTLSANSTTAESGLGFVTTPNLSGSQDQLEAGTTYRYLALAQNWSGSSIEYDVSLASEGLSIDPDTGLVVWRPGLTQLGEQRVILRARDGNDGVALQEFSLNVVAPNTLPVITSTPPRPAYVGIPYIHDVTAQDAESSALEFSMLAGPASSSIDRQSGRFSWTPTPSDVGTIDFVFGATDEDGLQAVQVFSLDVVADQPELTPPDIAPFRLTAAAGETYRAQVNATDALGRPISVSLDTGPAGMTLSGEGVLEWTPAVADIGQVPFTLTTDDGLGHQQAFPYALTVGRRLANRGPEITSNPVLFAVAGHEYAYDVAVTDVEHDAVSFELIEGPTGMSLDRERGRLRWMPPQELVGSHTVSLKVVDAYGAESLQSFELRVRRAGGPPVITSTPPTESFVGGTWLYHVVAADAEMDPLAYALLQAPAGMMIDAVTGEMSWTPAADQTGLQTVAIEVTDGAGGAATQSFAIRVGDGAPNEPPRILSDAERFGAVGSDYSYQVRAEDPEGTALVFSLSRGPAAMTIDPATGEIAWTPTSGDAGKHVVTVLATDAGGASAVQSFELDVLAQNRTPEFVSTPPTAAFAGEWLRYDTVVQDADLDPLTFELVEAPAGATLDAFGTLLWQTSTGDIGSHPITIRVADPRGGMAEQQFTLAINQDTVPPRVVVNGTGFRLPWNGPLSFFVSAIDNVGVEKLDVTVDSQPFTLQANGMGYLEFDEWGLGVHHIVATATDAAGNSSQATGAVAFCDPCGDIGSTSSGGIDNPLAEITRPADADTVTGMVAIRGTASIDGFDHYRLLYRRADVDEFTEFFQSSTEVTSGELGVWDTSLLENDEYVVRLEVVDVFGRVAVDDVSVGLSGALKLGNFRLSFTDMTIPVSGIPIQVARTYDTLRSDRVGDFGYGWRLEFRDADLRVGLPKSGLEDIGIYTPMRPGVKVYMTLPGQERMGWTFTPEIRVLPGLGDNLVLASPRFTPDPGNTAQLSVGGGQLFVNDRGELFAAGNIPWNPAAPDFGGGYTVVTRDGLRYHIDGDSGKLETVTDRNGNTLTFTESGIDSDSGVGVDITRDARGQIAAITDPAGNSVRYEYSAAGDLIGVIDAEQNRSTLTYLADPEHFLTDVTDAAGRHVVSAEFDSSGRYTRLVGTDGQTIDTSYDLSNDRVVYVDALGNTTTIQYDSRGNVIEQTDAAGGIHRTTYNELDVPLTETDPLGRKTTFTYDSVGNTLSQTDPAGNTTHWSYGRLATPLEQVDPLGNRVTLSTDEAGNVVGISTTAGVDAVLDYSGSDGTSRVTVVGLGTVTFDLTNDRPTTVVDPLGVVTELQYDEAGRPVVSRRDVDSGATTAEYRLSYDGNGSVIGETDPAGNTTTFRYDASGNPVEVEDSLGSRGIRTFDAFNRVVRTDFPDGTHSEHRYDAAGRVAATVSRSGRETRFEYDALSRLTAVLFPDATPGTWSDNPRRSFEYDLAGQLVATIDELGNRTEYAYDDAGNLISTTDPAGNRVQRFYDAAGRLVREVDPLGNTTHYEYDAAGRHTAVEYADGTTERYEYGIHGKPTSYTDASGATTRYEYDAARRLTAVVDPLGHRTSYGYDEVGQLKSITDALGRTTRFEYDPNGHLTARVSPTGERREYEYDVRGRLVAATTGDGVTIRYEYDAMDRVVREIRPEGVITTTYGPNDLPLSVTDATGTTMFSYDERDRLIAKMGADGVGLAYEYDDAGNITSLTSPSGSVLYAYDVRNLLTGVTDHAGQTTTFAYDASGHLQQISYPNGVIETRTVDARGRLAVQEWTGDDGSIDRFDYTFGPTGRRTSIVAQNGRRTTYQYDDAGRLVREMTHDPANGDRQIAFTYDAVGNRLSRNDSVDGTTMYQYDDSDRLRREDTGADHRTYDYDADGRLIRRTDSNGDTTEYVWTSDGRLKRVVRTASGNVSTVEYRYDPSGNRIARIEDGVEVRYLVGENRPFAQVIEEYAPDGTTRAVFTFGPPDAGRISQEKNGETSFLHADYLGSTRIVTDSLGDLSDRFAYVADGTLVSHMGTTDVDYLFAGEHRDDTTGLDYLRARYLDVSTGRFVSQDPFPGMLDTPISLHRYVYASQDPVNHRDPSGEATLAEIIVTSAIVGTLSGLGVGTAFYATGGSFSTGFWLGATIGFTTTAAFLSGGAATLASSRAAAITFRAGTFSAERFAALSTLNETGMALVGSIVATFVVDFGISAFQVLDYLLTPENLRQAVDEFRDPNAVTVSGDTQQELFELGRTLRRHP